MPARYIGAIVGSVLFGIIYAISVYSDGYPPVLLFNFTTLLIPAMVTSLHPALSQHTETIILIAGFMECVTAGYMMGIMRENALRLRPPRR